MEFPVVFVVDPELPDGIRNITLSYTFFEIGTPVARASATNVAGEAASASMAVR